MATAAAKIQTAIIWWSLALAACNNSLTFIGPVFFYFSLALTKRIWVDGNFYWSPCCQTRSAVPRLSESYILQAPLCTFTSLHWCKLYNDWIRFHTLYTMDVCEKASFNHRVFVVLVERQRWFIRIYRISGPYATALRWFYISSCLHPPIMVLFTPSLRRPRKKCLTFHVFARVSYPGC